MLYEAACWSQYPQTAVLDSLVLLGNVSETFKLFLAVRKSAGMNLSPVELHTLIMPAGTSPGIMACEIVGASALNTTEAHATNATKRCCSQRLFRIKFIGGHSIPPNITYQLKKS